MIPTQTRTFEYQILAFYLELKKVAFQHRRPDLTDVNTGAVCSHWRELLPVGVRDLKNVCVTLHLRNPAQLLGDLRMRLSVTQHKVSATFKIAIFPYLRFQRFQIDMLESFLLKKIRRKYYFCPKISRGKRFFIVNYLN